MKKDIYDVVIVGAGPAGLMAGVYAARYKLKTIIIGSLIGGLIGEAHEICNFPTYDKVSGFDLVQKLVNQVKNLGIEIKQAHVSEISGKDLDFKIKTEKNEYFAKKVLIATGSVRRRLGIEGEKNFVGKGISYCATCDAGFYKDKVAGVVGGSDAALTAALLLTRFAKKVYIFYRKPKFFRAEPAWVEEVEKNSKIEIHFETEIKELLGKEKLEGIKLNNKNEIKLDGLFVEIGSFPNNKIPQELGAEVDDEGYIKINKKQETSLTGVFAAGDLTDNPFKQAVTAIGEGAIAIHAIYEELSKIE